jgi:hypothetical protein
MHSKELAHFRVRTEARGLPCVDSEQRGRSESAAIGCGAGHGRRRVSGYCGVGSPNRRQDIAEVEGIMRLAGFIFRD